MNLSGYKLVKLYEEEERLDNVYSRLKMQASW